VLRHVRDADQAVARPIFTDFLQSTDLSRHFLDGSRAYLKWNTQQGSAWVGAVVVIVAAAFFAASWGLALALRRL
jgi:hypothetical protein